MNKNLPKRLASSDALKSMADCVLAQDAQNNGKWARSSVHFSSEARVLIFCFGNCKRTVLDYILPQFYDVGQKI